MTTRTVTVHYETDAGERSLGVDVSPDGPLHCIIETDLSDVPADELVNVAKQARDEFWAAERKEYERAQARGDYWREFLHDALAGGETNEEVHSRFGPKWQTRGKASSNRGECDRQCDLELPFAR